jgi:hypothetical protein
MARKPGQTPKPSRSSAGESTPPLDAPAARRVPARTRSAETRTPSDDEPNEVEDPPVPPLGRLPPSPPYPPLRRLVNRAKYKLWSYRLRDDLRAIRSRDTAENEGLRLPPAEAVIYHCLWLTEFYTPAETDEMVRRFETMRASMRGGSDHDFAK